MDQKKFQVKVVKVGFANTSVKFATIKVQIQNFFFSSCATSFITVHSVLHLTALKCREEYHFPLTLLIPIMYRKKTIKYLLLSEMEVIKVE